jgi:hypothetical protein
MAELRFRRILVDSRFRSSGTPSSFTYDLPIPVELPPGTTCYVSDVLVGNYHWSIESGVNDTFAVSDSGGLIYPFPTLAPGNYTSSTLGDAVVLALNANSSGYTGSFQEGKNTYTISGAHPWHFLLESENNCDHTLGLNAANSTDAVNHTIHPDVRGKAEQLLICGNIGRSETLGPKGPIECLCRVPLTAPPGSIMHYENTHPSERIDVGNQMLSRLHFRITDISGRQITGRGNISFSLLFE